MPPRLPDIPIGSVFNRWTVTGSPVIRRIETSLKYAPMKRFYPCTCKCGNSKLVHGMQLIHGKSTSCGCYKKEVICKHGLSKKAGYDVWKGMLSRCYNPKDIGYHNYGGRGISVCDEWTDIHKFFQDMGEVPPNKQIDRIDNNGNYCKDNCRWATSRENNSNRRNNVNLEFHGETKCTSAWAEEIGVPADTLKYRISRLGWSIEKALTTPTRFKSPNKPKYENLF